MTPALLDIHDPNLQLWHGDTRVQSPGYALIDGDHYVFGEPARAAARIHPRGINTRFWWQLGTEPLQPALGPARHTADLAHAHLQQLHLEANKPQSVILTTSSSMQRAQLALLLGIAQECEFTVAALVNRSVALGALHATTGRTWHLELQLHQACLSELIRTDGQVELGKVVPLPGNGLLQMQENLVKRCAKAFIEQTRFDPLRKAVSEQHLYDALPQALRRLQTRQETNLDVDGYQARILKADLATVGDKLINSLDQAISREAGTLLIDPVLTLLPGFAQALDKHNGEIRSAAAQDVCTALGQHGSVVIQRDGEHLHHVVSLPCLAPEARVTRTSAAPITPTSPVNNPAKPTHLLRGGQAWPLATHHTALPAGWCLQEANGHWQLNPGTGVAIVNATTHSSATPVFAGDTISIGEQPVITLIRVET
jgi:hypothetical protein